jgi:hypothetical protein
LAATARMALCKAGSASSPRPRALLRDPDGGEGATPCGMAVEAWAGEAEGLSTSPSRFFFSFARWTARVSLLNSQPGGLSQPMSARSAGLSLLILNTFGDLGGEEALAGAASALEPGETSNAYLGLVGTGGVLSFESWLGPVGLVSKQSSCQSKQGQSFALHKSGAGPLPRL